MQGSSGISGFFCIDKPRGWTSSDVVAVLRGALSKSVGYKVKVGHMGTLDPMATGVLPVAAGKATRLFDVLMNKSKGYAARMAFGYETDTLDIEGEVSERTDILPTVAQIKAAITGLTGEIEQIPPIYSAKSVGGVKAYKLARSGAEIQMRPVKVNIFSLTLDSVNGGKNYDDADKVSEIAFTVECGGGTYIRSLCRDIALACGSLGTMTELKRTYSGCFTLENAVGIEEAKANPQANIMPVITALSGIYDIEELAQNDIKKFTNGIPVRTARADGDVLVTIDGKEYAVAHCCDGIMKARINLW